MITHTITFQLPEDQEELDLTLRAYKMDRVITEFSTYLRKKYKHSEPKSDAHVEEFDEIESRWFDLLFQHLED